MQGHRDGSAVCLCPSKVLRWRSHRDFADMMLRVNRFLKDRRDMSLSKA